ncbi:MAG: flavodoxin family protein [Candidatus Izemoplasmatales bacterium]|nr:flavodoxin family protein [Candidatus Izemoplasmatales bacterium]
MILAISGSPRKNRMIHNAIKTLLDGVDEEIEIISLAGKRINGCIGCTQCANDNICKVKDDWNEIGEKMVQADTIIFGAPNYYGTINALAHACLERTFSFRHLEGFSLAGKKGIIISTTRNRNIKDPVRTIIERFMISNKMVVEGHIQVEGYDQCYTCGVGHYCKVGNVVKKHGILVKIEECHLPLEVEKQKDTMEDITRVKELLQRDIKY